MLEKESDRLEMIQSLDGQLLPVAAGTLWAIFDNEYLEVVDGIETRQPQLQCRTSDVERLELGKDTEVQIVGRQYRIRRHKPDGTGMSVLLLRL